MVLYCLVLRCGLVLCFWCCVVVVYVIMWFAVDSDFGFVIGLRVVLIVRLLIWLLVAVVTCCVVFVLDSVFG